MKMKKNELKELIALGVEAISGKILEAETELANFRLELSRGQIKNLRQGKMTRLTIARLKTALAAIKGAK